MRKSRMWILTAASLLALALVSPAVARAACSVTPGPNNPNAYDPDKNGLPDMFILGQPGTAVTVTIDAEPTKATVKLNCSDGTSSTRVYNANFYVFSVLIRGVANITFNVTGNWVGIHKKLAVQFGINPNAITIAGSGTMTDSSLLVELNGTNAPDRLAMIPPAMSNSRFETHADLVGGNDSAIVNLKNPITNGSVVSINVTTGDGNKSGGNNVFKVVQTALIDATVSVDIDGGMQAVLSDYGYLTLAGPIGPNGRLTVRSDLGEGANLFDGAISLPLFSVAAGGEVHIDIWGRGGTDNLSVSRKGTLAPTGGAAMAGLLDIYLDGGGGADFLTVDLAGGGLKLDGTLRIRENGGGGNDVLTSLVDVDASSTTPNLDVYLYGGPGIDRLNATIHDNGPRTPANYGPAGAVFLDGGLTAGDICSAGAGNTGLIHKRNCEG